MLSKISKIFLRMSQIREYNIRDKEACLIAFQSNVPLFFTEAEINQFEIFLDTFESMLGSNKTYFYVIVLANEIIGCGGFGDKDNTGIISLAWGLINNDFHKKGFGELLLRYRLELIKRLYPLKPIIVDTTQYSFGFFKKYGFIVSKITDDYYEKGMHRYDMIFKPD